MADYDLPDALVRTIAEQEVRLQKQERLVETMAAKGLSTKTAKELLELMRASLDALRTSLNHRRISK